LVGDETTDAAWAQAVEAALREPWVVQERVVIPEEVFPVLDGGRLEMVPLKVNVNPFYVAGADVGAVTRASRSSVIHLSAGGGSVPTFVVDWAARSADERERDGALGRGAGRRHRRCRRRLGHGDRARAPDRAAHDDQRPPLAAAAGGLHGRRALRHPCRR